MRGSRGSFQRGGGGPRGGSSYRGSNPNYRGNSGGGHSPYNSSSSNYGGNGERGGRYGGGGGNTSGGFRGGRGGYHGGNDSFNNSSESISRYPKPVNRYPMNSNDNVRNDNFINKRPYQMSSRDRSPDRKRIRSENNTRRNDDYGANPSSGGYHRGGGGGGGDSYDHSTDRYDNRRNESPRNSSLNRSSYREMGNNNNSSPTNNYSATTTYRARNNNNSNNNMGPPTSYAPTSRLRGGRIGGRGGTSFRGGTRGVSVRGRSSFKANNIRMSESGRLAELEASLRHRKLSTGSYKRSGSPDSDTKRKTDKTRSSIRRRDGGRPASKAKESDSEQGGVKGDNADEEDHDDDLDVEDDVTFADDDDEEEVEEDIAETAEQLLTEDEVEIHEEDAGNELVTEDESTAEVKKDSEDEAKDSVEAPPSEVDVKPSATKEVITAKKDEEEAVAEDVKANGDEDDDKKTSSPKKTVTDESLTEGRWHSRTRDYIKLKCVHCDIPSRTFNHYSQHLLTNHHKRRLFAVKRELQEKLHRLRKNVANLDSASVKRSFCKTCDSKVASPITGHFKSRAHIDIKRMLFPVCNVCDTRFTKMMDYELHRCSLMHIRREHQHQQLQQQQSLNDDPDGNFDWKEFTTVDCIGDVDGGDDPKDEDENGDQTSSANANSGSDEANAANENNVDISVGAEFVKDVQVKYCDLCQRFLSRDDGEAGVRKHCAERRHLNRYVEHKENERLRLSAVKIHQQEEKKRLIEKRRRAEKQSKDEANLVASSAEATSETAKDDNCADKNGGKSDDSVAGVGQEDDEEAMDSKIWADVDKDLGELLQAVSSENANDDEDEEDSTTTTERYDRFKNSVSGGDGSSEVVLESDATIVKTEHVTDSTPAAPSSTTAVSKAN